MFKPLSILIAAASFMTVAAPALQSADKLPTAAFAKLADMSQAKLSPNGDKIGYFIDYKGKTALVAANLDGTDPTVVPSPGTGSISQFYWGNNDIILIGSQATFKRDEFVRKTTEGRMYSYNLKTKEFEWLGQPKTRRSARSSSKSESVSQQERLVDLLPKDPDHILLQFDFDLDGNPAVFKVNIESGKRKEIRKERKGIQNWYTDQNSEIRLGSGYDGSTYKVILKNETGDWLNLQKTDWYSKYEFEGFTNTPNHIYVSGQTEHGTDGLFTLNINTGEVAEKLFSHEDVDIDYVMAHPITGKTAGVAYTTNLHTVKYFDKTLAKIQRSISKALKNPNLRLVDMAASRELYLFLASDDRDAGTYYLYDRDNKALEEYAFVRRHIDPDQMASVISVDIPSRDDDVIPSFITVPNGVETPKNMPTIILPHGGPYGVRDDAHWNYWTQFYANRGYLIVQPNFRGSGGYGDHHYKKGVLQWGGLMQDDVTDATKWVIEQGYTDPDKICIVGWSYGGYAALMGPIKEPGLYKCSISINGVSNLPKLKSNDKNQSIGGSSWIKRMGHTDKDDAEVSPYHRAAEMKIPVMLIATKDDTRVPYQHSESMHKALKKEGTKSKLVLFDEGGHSMYTSKNRKKMLEETEKFLKKHIGD